MNGYPSHRRYVLSRRRMGFTLVEVLVSTGIVVLLVAMLAGVVQQTSSVWRRTTGKIEQFRETRAAFEAMTTRLSQATLNTYWDYSDTIPTPTTTYVRRSELRFISGPSTQLLGAGGTANYSTHAVFFEAPLGETTLAKYRSFENLLCTCGYYVEYADDTRLRPSFLTDRNSPPRYRFRLMEVLQPAEANVIYRYTSDERSGKPNAATYLGKDWFTTLLTAQNPPVHALAENVIALIITPRLSPPDEAEFAQTKDNPDYSPLAPNYYYDSSPTGKYSDGRTNPINQLPPILQVTMVAIDEATALRKDFDAATHDPYELAGKFTESQKYTQELLAKGDDRSLENRLIEQRANYRIFTTNVVVRGAKWSRETTSK